VCVLLRVMREYFVSSADHSGRAAGVQVMRYPHSQVETDVRHLAVPRRRQSPSLKKLTWHSHHRHDYT